MPLLKQITTENNVFVEEYSTDRMAFWFSARELFELADTGECHYPKMKRGTRLVQIVARRTCTGPA